MLKRIFMIFFTVAFFAFAGLWIYVRYLETHAVFFPDRNLVVTPADVGLNFETVWMTTSDQVRLHGWYVPGNPEAGVVLFLHGNAGNIGGRVEKLEMFHRLGLNTLIIDYRGYGRSGGHPSVEGLIQDALAAYDFLVKSKGVQSQRMIIYGSSLGGVPGLKLAAIRTVGVVVMDSVFSSVQDMAREIYPWVPSVFVNLKMDNVSAVKNVTAPKLFIHSINDRVVPYSLGRKVFDAAGDPKTFLDLQGEHVNGHADDEPVYEQGLREFLGKHHLLEREHDG